MNKRKRVTVTALQPTNDEVLKLRPKGQIQAMEMKLALDIIRYKLDWNGVKTYGNLFYVCPECFIPLVVNGEGSCNYVVCMECQSHVICTWEATIKDNFNFVSVLLAKDQHLVELVESEG